ncbi:hypothetical protein SM114_03825 [Erwinia pyrifoliae]|uniref:cobalamin ABC transporter ATPase n=1 Tax=Erwinia pyrifoliae TaxID=79967 RepID=UPI000196138E|nr:cobalamin ABC transporter ATPase [Erwinia pyrifoliae]AUX71981.1 hypothetical protein CPI84_05490 [Erwinia pyrifoliae]CAX56360.1 conserved uncharacterized protein [Erwinia pyrifoliae Ep1/96]
MPADTSYSGSAPALENLYVPPAHLKALRPECVLVVGSRGVGKSVWTAALADPQLRKVIGSNIPELDSAEIHIGFSERPNNQDYPDADTFKQLSSRFTPYVIWRTIVVLGIAKLLQHNLFNDKKTWQEKVSWIEQNPERVAQFMADASQQAVVKNQHFLILFDALDRLSTDWSLMDSMVRDLLRVVLWLKPYPRLSAKVFLREDQLERTVTDFPDASKLLATKAELSWALNDLHGLLWQYLLNAKGNAGDVLRGLYQHSVGKSVIEANGLYLPHDEIKRETEAQRALFSALAGPWMGKDRRRGVPYIWAVSHLADGNGRTSPRSFLAAIRQAAEDSRDKYQDHPYPLHYESVKRGVQEASGIRVGELAEDYPWVRVFFDPLGGLTVPVDFSYVLQRWHDAFPNGPQDAGNNRLPPQHVEKGWPGIKQDLLRIGVFEERADERIDMPDLYRVGFGLGRKGGVKPNKQ